MFIIFYYSIVFIIIYSDVFVLLRKVKRKKGAIFAA